ncbi:NAD-dependent epimerase/dehydratase family protein [uncultured Clostridium sp.]|uniref:NAD-dependent epimerase/dehydratase family protein n=1 Tax=uncultured Clostridium sp. TaxID=59620 RepID=UPI002628F836|nr:NAD-dependent epimerase/dehydratase family protein [uncultured Clostridium sp.]
MKEILVLGGTRFFGKELVKELIKKGNNITILTRGNLENTFEGNVKHIIADRSNKESLEKAVDGLKFDIIYDNICYSPNDALISTEVFKNKVKRYIVTSSAAVYGNIKKIGLKESDFNPKNYKISFGKREDFSYEEGKRLMEAVFSKYASFEVVMVRFPIIIGVNDYTNRLNKYIQEISENKKIYIKKIDSKINFITDGEAAIFLRWLMKKEIKGPINAACYGDVSLGEIINIIEEECGEQAIVDKTMDVLDTSPYTKFSGMTLSTVCIRSFFNYRFKDARSEMRSIVKEIIETKNRNCIKTP